MDAAFSQWAPDSPDFETDTDTEALNVIPAQNSYRPFPALAAVTSALGARCQGAFFARNNAGQGAIFAGTGTKLYKTDGTSSFSTFTDVSRLVGGAYATPSDGVWTFTQFYDDVIATNGVDAPQKFAVSADANFSALGGSPLVSLYCAAARDFLFLLNTSSGINHLAWSGLGNDATWTQSQTTQADNQFLSTGGRIQGAFGGEYLVILQEFSIKRVNYSNVPAVFDFLSISDEMGSALPGQAIARYLNRIWCIDRTGFFEISNGQDITPIGEQRVDRWFWANVNPIFLYRVTAAVDPVSSLVVWAFPDNDSNASGDPNHLICYQYDVKKWSHCSVTSFEMIWSGATQASYTMDSLDNLTTNLDTFTIPLDSSSLIGPASRLLGGATSTHAIGFFNGANLAARVRTQEVELSKNRRSHIRCVRPACDGGTPTVTLGTRNRLIDSVTYGSAVTVDTDGRCWVDADARYIRGQIDIPAGSTWTHIQGLDDIEARASGRA